VCIILWAVACGFPEDREVWAVRRWGEWGVLPSWKAHCVCLLMKGCLFARRMCNWVRASFLAGIVAPCNTGIRQAGLRATSVYCNSLASAPPLFFIYSPVQVGALFSLSQGGVAYALLCSPFVLCVLARPMGNCVVDLWIYWCTIYIAVSVVIWSCGFHT